MLKADPAREVADEPEWTFAFQMTTSANDRGPVGYPVSWLNAPGNPYPQADAAALARRVETEFSAGRLPVTRRVRFIASCTTRGFSEPGKLLPRSSIEATSIRSRRKWCWSERRRAISSTSRRRARGRSPFALIARR